MRSLGKRLKFFKLKTLIVIWLACFATLAQGRNVQAQKLYRGVSLQQKAAEYDKLERAADLIRRGQLEQAEAELNSLLRATNRPAAKLEQANALNLLGVIRARQNRVTDAEQFFKRALDLIPDLTGAYVNLGELYLTQQNLERSLWAFTEASLRAPENPSVNFKLATLYEKRREYARALETLQKIPPDKIDADDLILVVKIYLGLEKPDEALKLTATLKESASLTAEMSVELAEAFNQHRMTAQAIEILEAARGKTPKSFPLLYELGASYEQKGEPQRAEGFYTAALEQQPDSVSTLTALARIARNAGEFEKALSHLIRARKLAPESASVLYDFGLTALHMDLILDAAPVFEKLYNLRPDEPAYIYMLAAVRFRNGDKAEAEKLLRRYNTLRPDDAVGYSMLGAILYSGKHFDEAAPFLQRSLAIAYNPDDEYLLGMISDTAGDKAEAMRRLEHVLKSEPNHAAATTALGIIYAEQKNYALAQMTLERAIKLNDKDLPAHYRLGLLYAKLGDGERAKAMFKIADRLRDEQRNSESVGLKLIDPPNEQPQH